MSAALSSVEKLRLSHAFQLMVTLCQRPLFPLCPPFDPSAALPRYQGRCLLNCTGTESAFCHRTHDWVLKSSCQCVNKVMVRSDENMCTKITQASNSISVFCLRSLYSFSLSLLFFPLSAQVLLHRDARLSHTVSDHTSLRV